MSREILFRGIDKESGLYVFGSVWIQNEYMIAIYDTKQLSWIYIEPETLGQYTGLKDKNGNKIFEGNIVKSNGVKLGVVKYFDREAGYNVENEPLQSFVYGSAYPVEHKHAYVELEVIGNIHEEAKQ